MRLPVMPPVAPMLASLVRDVPERPGLLFEPKWDGFRCLVFRDGEEVVLASRGQRELERYFPELPPILRRELPERCVVDGEIVIATANGLDFDALLQRIHPAASRVRKLSESDPASFIVFDVLAAFDEDLRSAPMAERRAILERLLADVRPPVYLTPATTDPRIARRWYERFEGAGLDGVMAKPLELPYLEGRREMIKVKHERTADCVVGGYRRHKDGRSLGSLLLGLYDEEGILHHVGVTSSFTAKMRRDLLGTFEALQVDPIEHPWGPRADPRARVPGGPSRWSRDRPTAWEPVRIERVVEVAYDHLQGDRFRHGTTFRRFRPDRTPASCRYDQLDRATPLPLSEVFAPRDVISGRPHAASRR